MSICLYLPLWCFSFFVLGRRKIFIQPQGVSVLKSKERRQHGLILVQKSEPLAVNNLLLFYGFMVFPIFCIVYSANFFYTRSRCFHSHTTHSYQFLLKQNNIKQTLRSSERIAYCRQLLYCNPLNSLQ